MRKQIFMAALLLYIISVYGRIVRRMIQEEYAKSERETERRLKASIYSARMTAEELKEGKFKGNIDGLIESMQFHEMAYLAKNQ